MNFKFLFFLFLLLVVAVFSVQNAGVVRLHFLVWEFSVAQTFVIFLSAFAGIALGALSSGMARRKRAAPPRADTPSVTAGEPSASRELPGGNRPPSGGSPAA